MERDNADTAARRTASEGRPWWLIGGLALALTGFAAGRLSASAPSATPPHPDSGPMLIQDRNPRELFPLPGPGQGFGLQPGEGECPLFLYQDGQLFRFDGQGQPGGPFPGGPGSPELFPLEPVPQPPPLLGPSDEAGLNAPSLVLQRASAA